MPGVARLWESQVTHCDADAIPNRHIYPDRYARSNGHATPDHYSHADGDTSADPIPFANRYALP
jgi:hypothetical protein